MKEHSVYFAGAILAAPPTVIVYIVSGRYFVRGLMTARRRKVLPGQTARLAFNLDKAVYFDPETQRRIEI